MTDATDATDATKGAGTPPKEVSAKDAGRRKIQERLAEKFRVVSLERLERLNLLVMTLESGQIDPAVVADTLREIHTLKGEARLVGRSGVGQMAHAVEDLLVAMRDVGWRGDAAVWDLVLQGLDRMADRMGGQDDGDWDADGFRRTVDQRLEKGVLGAAPRTAGGQSAAVGDAPQDAAHEAVVQAVLSSGTGAEGSDATAAKGPPTAPQAIRSSRARTRPILLEEEVLDELTSLLGELGQNHLKSSAIVRALIGASEAALGAIRLLETDAFRRSDLELAAGLGFIGDELQTALLEGAVLRELRFDRGLKLDRTGDVFRRLRMLPVSELVQPMQRMVRELGRDLGKEIQIRFEVGDVRLDQRIHGVLLDPLLHLLRNAADHGLESPEERVAKGKPAVGSITFSAQTSGAFVVLVVADDGRGIDESEVVARAVERGIVSPLQAQEMSRQERLKLILHRGLSTKGDVSQISGRGIGMDVVRHVVESLGGSIQLESSPEGTQFRATLPTSVALQSLVLLQTDSGRVYGLPSPSIVQILRLRSHEIKDAAGSTVFDLHSEILPLFHLGVVLGEIAPNQAREEDDVQIVVLEHGSRRIGLRGGRILGQESLVYRGLDSYLEALRLVAGTAVRSDTGIVQVLSVPELMRRIHLGDRRRFSSEMVADAEPTSRTVLVVDDSDLTRAMASDILHGYGHRTLEAANGREALERLVGEQVDLVVLDLDMPEMNGFEFLSACRESDASRGVPIVVFSSRMSEEDERRARELGAADYLVKSRYSEEVFLAMIRRFLA